MPTYYDLEKHHPAGRRAINAIFESLRETDNESIDLREDYKPDPPKFWPSNIPYIDRIVGGFYGMTTLAAEKGTGKSMICTASAIEAAASGRWQVALFVAEDDYDGFRERFNFYLHSHPSAHDCYGNLHLHAVGRGQTPESIAGDVATSCATSIDTPILVCLDSINSIVNLSGRPYLAALASFGLWAMFARRVSRGDVSFLITSETNKRGESKGEQLPSWSDCYLKMVKKSENVVSMRLDKTRRTSGEGELGKFLRDWPTQTFLSHSEPELRVVGGREYD